MARTSAEAASVLERRVQVSSRRAAASAGGWISLSQGPRRDRPVARANGAKPVNWRSFTRSAKARGWPRTSVPTASTSSRPAVRWGHSRAKAST